MSRRRQDRAEQLRLPLRSPWRSPVPLVWAREAGEPLTVAPQRRRRRDGSRR